MIRPGWEFNTGGATWAGNDSQTLNDWVAAYQHVYTVLHAAGKAAGVTVEVMWNPSATNYTSVPATAAMYPGDQYVDSIGVDVYGGMYPFSDGGSVPTYHDWKTGGEDTDYALWMSEPANRSHYFSYPAATEWSLDGSDGHSQSFLSVMQFAKAHNKPFAVPETGCGSSYSGHDLNDDPTFPRWLGHQLRTAQTGGLKIEFVGIWDANNEGNYEFSNPGDHKPHEAIAWATNFGGSR